eukprot:snap_masked-scaffold_33-processed-gene-3.12-mRNA-1 protein AED:0.01 eAED:0.01 QI:0/-1/0/1/-1/1/1/0/490
MAIETKQQLENIQKVVDLLETLLHVPDAELQQPEYRQLRVSISKFYTKKLQKNFFKGLDPKEYKSKKQKSMERERIKTKKKYHDDQHMKKRELRKQRQENLQKLLDEQPHEFTHLLIPDGAASRSIKTITGKNHTVDKVYNHLSCYCCKARFQELHFFYSHFCPRCADLNWQKRNLNIDMGGKICLVTGGRIKIGFETAVKLLRMGAKVLITTRFPNEAAARYEKLKDFATFESNLEILGLDFKNIRFVELLAEYIITKYSFLDVLINNACQTIRRPTEYYNQLLLEESKSANSHQLVSSNFGYLVESHFDDKKYFPDGLVDVNGQQVDLRKKNSWTMKVEEVETSELVEVLAVNSVAPFILTSKLKPLLVRAAEKSGSSYVVNVSAMEGKFYRYKNSNHPHTNMAKAALNMLTRTSAADYAKSLIFMNSVDTGWINDENPIREAARIHKQNGFQTPIDEIDAASRILDPVLNGKNEFGKFLKDYRETEW